MCVIEYAAPGVETDFHFFFFLIVGFHLCKFAYSVTYIPATAVNS